MEGADKGERVEELVRGACNEAPAVVSVVLVEVAWGTEVAEAFTFVARRRLILSPTQEARSRSAEECEAVGRREVAEREFADSVTATLVLPVVWWSFTFAVLKGATPPIEGVELVLENEVGRGLFTVTDRRERGEDGDWVEVNVPVGKGRHEAFPSLTVTP